MPLSRKTFLKGLAIGALSLPFAVRLFHGKTDAQSGGADFQVNTSKRYSWKLVTTWPPNFPVLGEGCKLFADWVREMSGGRLDIQVYGGGELVPALEAFDAVRTGAAEMGSAASYYWAGKLPAAQLFASVPFGMNAQQVNAWLQTGDGMALWESLYADFGLIPLPGGNSGVQMGGWFNREINEESDLKGLKMRIPGLGGKVLERAGGAPVLLAGGELYTSLERGVIDAAEWIGPYHDYIMGFHEIARYYYAPGWHEPGSVLELFVNKSTFEALPADLQAIVRTASHRLSAWILYEFETKNALYLQKIQEETQVELRLFPPEVLENFRAISNDILQELADSDPDSKKVLESYRKFMKQAHNWGNYSERAYFNNLYPNGSRLG